MRLPPKSVLQVAVLLQAATAVTEMAAKPATTVKGASVNTTPVVAFLRKDSFSTVVLAVLLMLVIGLKCVVEAYLLDLFTIAVPTGNHLAHSSDFVGRLRPLSG